MTFTDALRRKIRKIRLYYFRPTAYVDPRVTERISQSVWAPILDPANTIKDGDGTLFHPKVLIDEKADVWQAS